MSSRHPKRRITARHFAFIPVEVLQSDTCMTLPNYSVRVLLAIAAQYRGNNNGDLSMTRSIALSFGIRSQQHLVTSLSMLLERGLIEKTRQGGKKPFGPTLYAITWQPIDDIRGKIGSGPTTTAKNTWVKWSPDLPGHQPSIKHQVRRRTASGLPADHVAAESGLPADQIGQFNGSAGSPPSRLWGEGVKRNLVPVSAAEARDRHSNDPQRGDSLNLMTAPVEMSRDGQLSERLIDSVGIESGQLTLIDAGVVLTVPDLESQLGYTRAHAVPRPKHHQGATKK
jgi:hypothetical protein